MQFKFSKDVFRQVVKCWFHCISARKPTKLLALKACECVKATAFLYDHWFPFWLHRQPSACDCFRQAKLAIFSSWMEQPWWVILVGKVTQWTLTPNTHSKACQRMQHDKSLWVGVVFWLGENFSFGSVASHFRQQEQICGFTNIYKITLQLCLVVLPSTGCSNSTNSGFCAKWAHPACLKAWFSKSKMEQKESWALSVATFDLSQATHWQWRMNCFQSIDAQRQW